METLFQIKLMEEKNTVLMQTNVSLEEELRKANAAKGQLETYKRQVPELLQSAKGVRFPINDTGCSPPPPHRWWSCRTDCRKSLKKPTRWSLSTNA